MDNTIIKICGIRDADTAVQVAQAGANYIGLIFYPQSKRYVDIENAKQISKAIKNSGALPVAVFVDQSAQEMEHICKITDIQVVQLHGEISKKNHCLLPEIYQRIFVFKVDIETRIENTIPHRCYSNRDFFMFDAGKGEGKKFAWEHFKFNNGEFRWFLAGGLNVTNVRDAINLLKPTGVDVSSGVEDVDGKKDIVMVREFIRSCHPERK